LRSYERHVHSGTKLKAFFGKNHLSSISAFMIEKYKRERKEAKAADATINRELALLKNLFNLCIKWGFAKKNPVSEVKLYREDNGRTRYLTQEEAQMLLATCNTDFRVVVLTAIHTGFRKSEIMSLRWSSVNMGNRSITVESCYAKNGETRTVPMTEDLFEALSILKTGRDRDTEDLVFISRYGKPWKDWRTAFCNAVERAGLKDFRFHDLRHCYGSWLAMSGVTSKAQMELMGHKDPKMTMRYTHLSMDYKREFVAKLPKLGVESPQISPSTPNRKVVGFPK
jgi:integrase